MGGGGKGGNTTTSTFQPPQAFMRAYKESLKMARDAVDDPYRRYRGDLVADLTPTQKSGIRNINKAQGMALPAIKKGMDYTRQAAKGITPELYKRFYSPYVKDVADTTFANLMESQAQQQSGLKSGAIQAGAFGGDRGGIAQAEMARQQQLGNAMAMSNIYNQGYGQAMGLAGQQVANRGAMGQQLAGLGAAAQGSVLQGAQAQMAAGAQQQATKQAKLQAAYQQWMQKQAYPYQNAQFFANIAQGLGAGAGGTSSTTGPEPSLMSQILGGVGAIGSIYGASDKRVKENIEAVGTLNDGQTVYRYNFKGDPKTQIGLLAQEVEEQKPGAVTQVKGLKMVDYKGATDDAAKMSSMGGVVAPSMNRQGLAGGGIPYYPYGDAESYVPEGKIGANNDTIAYRAPKPQTDGGLSEDWKDISPISSEQASGLRAMARDVGLELPSAKGSGGDEELERSGLGDIAYKIIARPSLYASGGLVGRKHYQDGGMEDVPTNEGLASVPAPTPAAEPEFKYPTNEEVEAYIAQEAARRNIDPEVALRVWRSEGASGDPREAWQSKVINKRGERERSYGPYQLYMEGGLGNEMVDKTGLSPEDPRNWKPSVGFALDQAATGGWGPWHGAKAIGLDEKAGLANARPIGDYSGTRSGVGVTVAPVTSDAEGLAAVPAPETGTSGLVIKGEKPRSKFDLSKIFASEENPSLIEKIMGRRLSPEARAAVMNASFALMAGRSPFFFTNLGEAGKVGTQTYYNALQQSRELAKQQAEIGLTQEERDIQRTNAATARINAARQLYAQMLPQIKFWQMRNPGKPLPPEYRRVIDAAYPAEGPAGLTQAPGLAPELSGPATGASESIAPSAPPVSSGATAPVPPADGSEAVNAPPSSGNPEVDRLYAQLPDELNPNYWTSMAQNAMTSEDYTRASQRAAELTELYMDKGIPVPGGAVIFPGKPEMEVAQELRKLQTEGNYKATSDQTERAQRTIEGYQTTRNTLNQAADTLAKTPTGQFSDAKAYAVTALYSLGLGADAEALQRAQGTQELNKIFSQILFSGGLKDKIGSQIAATELQMFSRGFGDVSLEPSVNRFIVGTMRGILEMEKQRSQDWIAELDSRKGQPMSRREIVDWEIKWNEQNPLSKYIDKGIGSTPAAGEVNWSQWGSDKNYRNKVQFKSGYQYVMPDGQVKVYTGNPEDKYFLNPQQYQETYGGEE